MSNQPVNLWWVYDPEDRSFSTLPTGPFLVPAIIIAAIVSLFTGKRRRRTLADNAGSLAHSPEWQEKYKRYNELVQKKLNSDLELHEIAEFDRIQAYVFNPHGYH